jgi:hypothetical protein
VRRLWNFAGILIASIYFLLDALFAAVAIPLGRWISRHWAFKGILRWIRSLRPYPTLLLFLVPLIVLEPVKPAAAYLVATGRALWGCTVLAVGELLKLVLVERLFCITRDKLLSIPAFAWSYKKYLLAKAWITSLEAWQLAERWVRAARYTLKSFARQIRKTGARGKAVFQP